jgi:hypothetical protein
MSFSNSQACQLESCNRIIQEAVLQETPEACARLMIIYSIGESKVSNDLHPLQKHRAKLIIRGIQSIQ